MIRSEAVHVSQIGFRSGDPDKSAFLSIWMGSGGGYKFQEGLNFSLINDITNEKVYTGKAVMQWEGAVPEMIGSKKITMEPMLYDLISAVSIFRELIG